MTLTRGLWLLLLQLDSIMASDVVAVNESDDKGEKNKTGDETVELQKEADCSECYLLFWKAKIITVEPVAFFYTLGMYFSVSFTFQYFYQRYARERLPESVLQHHFCITDDYLNMTAGKGAVSAVEDHATHLTFLVALTGLLMSVASTIFIGPITDRFGRRFAIVSANFGGIIGSLFQMIIIYKELDLHYFIAANLVSSFFGGFGVLFAGSFSYIADVSSHKTRSLRIGILELMVYISSALTSVFVGIWLSEVDCSFTSLTWAPFISYVISLLYSLFLLPDSLSTAQRQQQAVAEKIGNNKLETLWKGILLYFRPKLVTIKLWICLGVLLIVIINITGSVTINTYFYIQRPLEWSPEEIGLYGGYNAVTHGLALLLLMPIALVIGVPDVILAIIGVLSSCLGYLFIAGVKKTWQMYASE